MKKRKPPFSLIGAGTVGSTLASALHAAGYRPASIISRSGAHAVAVARTVGCSRASTDPAGIDPASEMVIIAASDDALPGIAAALRGSSLRKGTFVAHCAGAIGSAVLAPLAKRGMLTASMHPIRIFPKDQSLARRRGILRGASWGIEGSAASLRWAESVVRDLGGTPVTIAAAMKPLYHAACVFSAGYFSVLLGAIRELSLPLDLPASWSEIFGPLMAASMEQAVRGDGNAPLTGPIPRGDLATVRLHLDALAGAAPHLLPLYAACGIEAARRARRSGDLDDAGYRSVVAAFRTFVATIKAPAH